ncbi:hypothetical protein ANO11243_096050 [Dothideomycetidae sp. 11243]|nr:hypothetical protein ANO11243_096050 [fungal sp. No.11243]
MARLSDLAIGPLGLVGVVALLFITVKVCEAIYIIFFHPLRKIPGPWWAALSRLPYAYHHLRGTSHKYLQWLHAQYGPMVRYSPNEISAINGDTAWQEIYGFRTGKLKDTQSFTKDLVWYPQGTDGVPHLLNAPDGVHGRQRRVISHAFSEKSLRNQEWLVQKYANLLITRLGETEVSQNKPSNLAHWFSWTTFDVIADLTFGESDSSVGGSATTQSYVAMLEGGARIAPKIYCMRYWPSLQRIYQLVYGTPKNVQMRLDFQAYVKARVLARVDDETNNKDRRQDFMSAILQKQSEEQDKGNEGVTVAEIVSNAFLFLIAGTETSATVLQCATYFMLRDQDVYVKVKQEVRSLFKTKDDITIESVSAMTYTNAVLTETMRIMPPVAAGFPRKVPASGATVGDYYLPGNYDLSISMSQHASYNSPSNFTEPDYFDPQRWLGDAKYKDDNRATFSPFSFGPRNCIGRNLAYAETRMIFAKLVLAYDMQLEPGMSTWLDHCTVGALWFKPPLMVRLTPAR